jgi:signal peptidase II
MQYRYKLAGGLALLVLVLDLATKYAVISEIPLHGGFRVIPGFNMVHVTNSGAAFGFLAGDSAWRTWFFLITAVLAVAVIIHLLRTEASDNRLMSAGLGLILGGAIGNFIDRLDDGLVVDFLDLYVGKYHWPAFNVADTGITLGALAFIVSFYQRNRRRKRK